IIRRVGGWKTEIPMEFDLKYMFLYWGILLYSRDLSDQFEFRTLVAGDE
ncbi:4206_t:CDS:1, partial [Funneliformis mosseae]